MTTIYSNFCLKSLAMLALLYLANCSSPDGQKTPSDKEKAAYAAVAQLFEGMRNSDSTLVRAVCHPDLRLQTIVEDSSGNTMLRTESVENFLAAVGQPKDLVWDEQVTDYEVQIDGKMAAIWTNYRFYRGENFSHCGANAFQLVLTKGGWKIIQITDTRRKEGC